MNIADIAQQGDFDTLLRVVDNHPNVDQTDVYGGTAHGGRISLLESP